MHIINRTTLIAGAIGLAVTSCSPTPENSASQIDRD